MKYNRLPATVDAIRWTGENWDDARAFVEIVDGAAISGVGNRLSVYWTGAEVHVCPGSWVVRDRGHFYAVSADVFAATFAAIDPRDDA